MAVDAAGLVDAMVFAGQQLGSDILQDAQSFLVPELRKIAVQIAAIAEHAADYTPDGARALLDMQVRASAGIIVAMTAMTIAAVQDAINTIMEAVSGLVNEVVGFVLIP
jgi:hypothetical protein